MRLRRSLPEGRLEPDVTKSQRSGIPVHAQLRDLTAIQLKNWRWSWPQVVLLSIVTPLISIGALGTLASDDPDALHFIFVGNVVLSLLFQNQNIAASNFSYMKATGALTFFSTLPIVRGLIPVGTAMAFLMLSLPAMVVTVLAGSALLDISIDPSPALVIVVPLAVAPMCFFGALIGSIARTPELSSSYSLGLTMVFVSCGPVLLPEDRLPSVLVGLGWGNPATYASSALRQALLGPVDLSRLTIDVAAMALCAMLGFLAVDKWMSWSLR